LTEPTLSTAAADHLVELKTAPRVHRTDIEKKIYDVNYVVNGTLTICIIEMWNGFQVVGTSACADPANFDRNIGERYAYDAAFKQLWSLEGYLLREKLYEDQQSIHEAEKALFD
jgi:hypothetical protein